MKNNLYILSFFAILFVHSKLSAQNLDAYYSMFDNAKPITGFLLNKGFGDPQSLEKVKIKYEQDGIGYTTTDPGKWQSLYRNIQSSEIEISKKMKGIEFYFDPEQIKRKTNTSIPIGIVNVVGEFLNPDLIPNYFDNSTQKL